MRTIAPTVEVISTPFHPADADKSKRRKIQLPTKLPRIPKTIFMRRPVDFERMITPASQPAIAPISTETKISIVAILMEDTKKAPE